MEGNAKFVLDFLLKEIRAGAAAAQKAAKYFANINLKLLFGVDLLQMPNAKLFPARSTENYNTRFYSS